MSKNKTEENYKKLLAAVKEYLYDDSSSCSSVYALHDEEQGNYEKLEQVYDELTKD